MGLTKKGTSFFSFMNEEPKHENIFCNFLCYLVDEYELNSECFMLKDLMSLKRISHNESRLFDWGKKINQNFNFDFIIVH